MSKQFFELNSNDITPSAAQLYLSFSSQPLVMVADHLNVEEPFLHVDRTADFHVLIYVLRGRISVVEEGVEYHITAGKALFLKSGLQHYGVTPSELNSEWIYVHFYLDMPSADCLEFRPYLSHLQEQIFDRLSYQYKLLLPKFFMLKDFPALEYALTQFVARFHSSNPFRAIELSPAFFQFLLDCHKACFSPLTQHYTKKVHEIIQYLETHTHEPFHTNMICETFFLSYKHLARIFKEETNMTMLSYHTNLRMHEAAKLLRESNLSISEISTYMGYEEPFYFSNVFHKVHGLSPKDYRKRYQ